MIFEISRDVCQGKGSWSCTLDLLPELPLQKLTEMLEKKRDSPLPASELLTGILHNRLGRVVVQMGDIDLNQPICKLSAREIQAAARMCKAFTVSLTEPLGMDSAQVTAGGMETGEFNRETMESQLVPGLYACGEVLDIDGDCGGYNLQWAWSSGRLAGSHAGKE